MKKDEVPQDKNRTYGGHKKIVYAVNTEGKYETISSSGWQAEEFVTLMAVDQLNELALAAYHSARQGASSPLEYHMYAKRLDIAGLSQATGLFQWRIKRHLKPTVFANLPPRIIKRYLAALGLTEAELRALPDKAPVL
jgi:hypothetical protein